jgi:hypothetical protein
LSANLNARRTDGHARDIEAFHAARALREDALHVGNGHIAAKTMPSTVTV